MTHKPYYWLNSHSRLFLERGYLEENKTPEDRIKEIAINAEKILNIKDFATKFEHYMSLGYYSLSTPVWNNFGNARGLPVSCFGSYMDDTITSILYKVAEVGMMSKLGGGTSGYFGELRGRGSSISVGGESSGPVHFMEMFDKVADVISQGCYDYDTEILTDCGWKFFKDLSTIGFDKIKVAQVNDDETIEFVKIQNYFEYEVSENLIWFKDSKNIDLLVTKNHNMAYKQEKKNILIDNNGNKKYERNIQDKFYTKTADQCPLHRDIKYLHAAYLPNTGLRLSNWERILIATQADGSYNKNSQNAIKYRFAKKRKADRLKYLLESLNIEYSYSYYNKDKTHNFYVNFQERLPKTLEWVNISNKSYDWCVDFISEILEWDGSKASDNSGVYSSIIKDNVDKVQEVCAVSGYKSYTSKNDRENEPTKSTIYSVYISRGNYFGVEKLEKQEVFYTGKVYCVEVPSHKIIIRRFGRTLICGNSARRGSFAAYLPVEHPDIEEFLQIRNEGHPIQNMSIGVTISDNWMKSMVDGDKNKRKIWAKIIQKRFETGYPYIFFTDTINKNSPQVYRDKNLKINSSNLCVTGDQRVVSNFGLLTAKELYNIGDKLILFDNNKQVNASPMQLIEKNADVYRITLDNGMSHTITKYHKVCVFDYSYQTNFTNKRKVLTKNIECKDLKIGDEVAIQTNKGIFGSKNMSREAFLLGLYQADGTQNKDQIMIDIWEKDFDLLTTIQSHHDYVCKKYKTQYSSKNNRLYNNAKFHTCVVNQSKVQKKRLCSKALKKSLNFQKGSVPNWIWESNEKTQWQYIKGLYYADGTVFKAKSLGEPISISLANINKEFLQEVQLILANLGMQSSIRILRKAGKQYLPDGKGGYKFYNTKDCWRLIIGNKNDALIFNKHTGFLDRKGIVVENRQYRNNTKKFYKIVNIEYIGKEDVYCCKVDSPEHLWVCNGIVTHNCSEITLNSDENNSFVCVLSSLNLLHWDEIEKTDAIETMIYFLDSVNQEFINKTENIRFMKSARNFAINQRALGMGVLGWHSYLQSKMIGFESMGAKMLNNQIWRVIREKSDNATIKLAEQFGEAPILEGYGRRNVTTLAVAPTTSSSFILGQVSPSIEPLNSNYFVKNLAKGKFTYKNPYLKEILKKYHKNDDATWKSILIKGGSVQHLDFLTKEEKEVFKTFGEISQKEIVIQASQRQKFIDQSQSLNLMIPPDTLPKQVSDLLIEGWRLGIKTFYYQRSANPAQELARSILTCSSCES